MKHFLIRNGTKLRTPGVSLLTAVALVLASCTQQNMAPPDASRYQTAMRAVSTVQPQLIAFRHDIHRHPELAGRESRTAAKVAGRLNKLGFEVRSDVGGYGLVAVLEGKYSGPLVAFRADMDAVAGDALDPVPYASEVEDAHHICGHDIHTTIGVGIAEGFAAIQSTLAGSVMLIFQPAEEAGTGAESMLKDALFGNQMPRSIFAVHAAPFEVDQIATLADGMMAGRSSIQVALSGAGNLEQAAVAVRQALVDAGDVSYQEMLSFQKDPFIFVDLAPQQQAENQEVDVSGFVMSAGVAERARVEAVVRRAVSALDFPDLDISIDYRQAMEGVNNSALLVSRSSAHISENAPELQLVPVPGVIPAFSEDFGSFQRTVPGVMYYLGVNNSEAGTTGFPHSPDFVADDGAILVGIKAMLAAMIEELYLQKNI